MPKGIYKRRNGALIPEFAERLLDSNLNCCFNCVNCRLYKHGIVSDFEDYRNLRARCMHPLATKEDERRRRPFELRIFSYIDINKIAKMRKNCKYFELG